MNSDNTNISNEQKKNLSVKMSVRVNADLIRYIDICCEAQDLSRSELIRAIIEAKIEKVLKYNQQIKYVNAEQANDIKQEVLSLINTVNNYIFMLQQITKEMNRIGINYDQQLKRMNQELKNGDTDSVHIPSLPIDSVKDLIDKAKLISDECNEAFKHVGGELQWLL